jgi:ribosome-associated protein
VDTSEHDEDEFGPSRSQRRREALAVLGLAEKLVALPPNRLDKIELPDDVRAEIANVRRMRAHGARKRQMAFLAKLMRRHDEAAFEPAQAELGENRAHRRQEHAALQRLETLRERLLDDEHGDDTLSDLISRHPDIDRQHLRSLIRQARSERQREKPPRASRELFRLLRATTAEE